MASQWQVRIKKEQIERADHLGKHVTFVGYYGGGRAEAFMYMDPDSTTFLWLFAHELNRGKSPAEAFAEAQRKIDECEIRRKSAATTEAVGP